MKTIYSVLSLGILTVISAGNVHATTDYFMHGYGVKSQGNAGTSIANLNDTLTIASNPAGLSWGGRQLNLGATVFAPERSSSIQGSPIASGEYDANGREYFVIPEVAYSHPINNGVAVGCAVYRNGGMNTSYKQNPFQQFGSSGTAGVNLSQVFFLRLWHGNMQIINPLHGVQTCCISSLT